MADGGRVQPFFSSAADTHTHTSINPNPSFHADARNGDKTKKKTNVVVIMGATGAGKSKLSIDLASHFSALEILNADSMQVYSGLDVLTNKVPLPDRAGIPHHLLGTVDASVEFTSKHFRDSAIPIIDDILSRDGLPVIFGGTNYYIQALLSPFLFDDMHETLSESDTSTAGERDTTVPKLVFKHWCAPQQAFPRRYFSGQGWGRDGNFRYQCCILWIDASLDVLDKYVNERVDEMMHSGLLDEVASFYDSTGTAVYTKGLLQAIGVREFDEFFRKYGEKLFVSSCGNIWDAVMWSGNEEMKLLMNECVDKLKINTRRLVRRQRRRLTHLSEDFGWNLHRIDATEAFLCREEEVWRRYVMDPSVATICAFLSEDDADRSNSTSYTAENVHNAVSRDLWTQFICEACGNRILRGVHEWEQHRQGRVHRKRAASFKKRNLNTGVLC